jgi:hypothetical protein
MQNNLHRVSADILKAMEVMTRMRMMMREAMAAEAMVGEEAGAGAEEVNLREVEMLHVVEVVAELGRVQILLTLMTVSH